MPFKRNEPGCDCCGYGLTGELGGLVAYRRGPGTDTILNSTPLGTYTFASQANLGVGSRLIGANTEEDKILIQRADGAIWQLQAKTLLLEELFDNTTDIAGVTLEFCIYQPNWEVGAARTSNQIMSFDNTGTFILPPVGIPNEPDYVVVTGITYRGVTVNEVGETYIGSSQTGNNSTNPYTTTYHVYKNTTEYAETTASTNQTTLQSLSGRVISTNPTLHFDGEYYVPVRDFNDSPTVNAVIKSSGGGSLNSVEPLWYLHDVLGIPQSDPSVPFLGLGPYCYNNTVNNTVDIRFGDNHNWYRVSEDLSVNTHLLRTSSVSGGAPTDVIVIYSGTD